MNQKQRAAYSNINTRQLKRIENKYIPAIYGALRQYVLSFIDNVRNNGLNSATGALDKIMFIDGMAETIRAIYIEGGLFFGNKARKEITKSTKDARMGVDEQWTADIIAYFKTYLLNKAVLPITQHTREQIYQVLITGQEQGLSIEAMIKRLTDPDFFMWRARMIARTETLKASEFGRQLAQRDSEWETRKEWVATIDHRTRHWHMAVNGEVVDGHAKFNVGGEMMSGPGDPSASAENVINCRCALAVVAARDKNGNLIKKKTGIHIIMPEAVKRPVQTILI